MKPIPEMNSAALTRKSQFAIRITNDVNAFEAL